MPKKSLKIKAVIASVLAVIAVVIIVYTGIENHKNVQKEVTAENAKGTGSKLTNSDNNDAAKKAQDEAAKKAADDKQKELEALYQQGYNEFNNRNYWKAADLEQQVIDKDNTFYKAYNVKGIALCYAGKYIDGSKAIDQALALKPDYGYAMFNKALSLELYAHYDEALSWYDKAIAANGNVVWAYYGKASIYGRRGDVVNSVSNLKTAISMEADVKDEAKKEKDFDNVRNSKEFQSLVNN